MAANATSTILETIIKGILADPGLKAETSASKIAGGIVGARSMNDVLGEVIEKFKLNADKMITPAELMRISDYVKTQPLLHYNFLMGHGDDNGNVETGFHKVQNDGSTLLFQGRNFVDTVADAIYHYGEDYQGANFLNEDGNQNEEIADVAGWLNYFLNGKTMVFGGSGADELGSGDYSSYFAKAADETFHAYGGNDKIWAHTGNDTVHCGVGDDTAGGGIGNDTLNGEDGLDKLYGDAGNDTLNGGKGVDKLNGGVGNDTLNGDADNDELWGDLGDDTLDGGLGNDSLGGGDGNNVLRGGDGNDEVSGGKHLDKVYGGSGNDDLHGGEGNDYLYGEAGNDEISAGEGIDSIRGGLGADKIFLWDNTAAADRVIIAKGESGRLLNTFDRIEGFTSGEDKLDMRAFVGMKFGDIDYTETGPSCYYDGRFLRIDHDGDRATDMLVEFAWLNNIKLADLMLA